MRVVVAWDTETCLIRPGLLAPPLVCVTYQSPGTDPQIVHAKDAEPLLRSWLLDPNVLLVGHNVAYDLAVICEAFPHLRPLVFAAYDVDRITDTQIRQWLLDTAGGCLRGRPDAKGKWIVYQYTLADLAKRLAGVVKDGEDPWRLRYAELLTVPLAQWPAEALHYALNDARSTLAVYQGQERANAGVCTQHSDCRQHPELGSACFSYLHDQFRQARAYFALHLNSAWGLRTDAAGVEALRVAVEADLAEAEEELIAAGLMRANGTRDTKRAKARMVEVCRAANMAIPRTDGHFARPKLTVAARQALPGSPRPPCRALDGSPLDDGHDDCAEHVSLDSDACERSEDDLLETYSHAVTLRKQLSNDIVALQGGVLYPVHTRYGWAASGRTTSSRPNIQNQSKREGIREAFVPRGVTPPRAQKAA